jgi:lysophospholipase L1-like esterase
MKIVCLGDSLTYGYGNARRDIWTNLAAQISGFEIVNKGINGDTSGGMLSRFKRDVLDEKPSAVLLICGANDIFASLAIDNLKANVFSMRHLAANAQIAFILGTLPPIQADKVPPQWAAFADMTLADKLCGQYSQWVKAFCKAFGVFEIDFRALFERKLKENPSLYLDGLHPNKEGQRLMAELAAQIFKEIHGL